MFPSTRRLTTHLSHDAEERVLGSEQPRPQAGDAGAGSQDTGGTQGAPVAPPRGLNTNPLRDLGGALNEIRKQFNDILEAQEQPSAMPHPADSAQLEYVRPDEDAEMEALGPAGEEEAARLGDLKLVDDEVPLNQDDIMMDVDEVDAAPLPSTRSLPKPEQDKPATALEGVESAVTDAQVRAQGLPRRSHSPDATYVRVSEDIDMSEEEVVEATLKKWQEDGRSEADGVALWRLYEGLTHDLAHTLCEQLRLVLAPTLATRLRGDYRTGKRLNMKKVVPYVASEFRKDRIWLRRTRPSARAYQVLLALDDSRSMAAGRSAHLAFETLALVSRALSRLEVGQVALARFGRDVDVLHAFEDGPLGDAAGARALAAFGFNQQATDVLGLLRASLRMLADARARQSGAEELWQLMVVMSDGVCQDHDALRAELRRAEEARVLVVFVVLDALHTHAPSDATDSGPGASILSMTQVRYKDVAGGAREMVLERYMDSFPFEYYVVLRRAEALPDVLASTLRQFFERVAGE
jgi:midasin